MNGMMLLIGGMAFTGMTLWSLRGGLVGRGGLAFAGFDLGSLGLGGLAVLAAAWFFGPMIGLALVLSVMIHEFGHVAAFRVAGHHDARFRLVPLIGGYAISDRLPDTQAEDFFITLLGPGISIAPMVLAFALSHLVYESAPLLSDFLSIFGGVMATLNFLNLLPFWPLDGGRCVRAVAWSFWPGLARVLTVGMSAALAAVAVSQGSILLLGIALLGALSLMHADRASRAQRPMTWRQAVLALSAYLFTAAAHLAGGWWLMLAFL